MSLDYNQFNEVFGYFINEHDNYCNIPECHLTFMKVASSGFYYEYITIHKTICDDIECCIYINLEKTVSHLLGKDITLIDER